MSFTGRITSSIGVGAMSGASQIDRVGGAANNISETIPVAIAGVLTTRTDDDSGIITSNGHPVLDTDKICIFWATGCVWNYTVLSHDANTFTIDVGAVGGGTGVLPAALTAVTVHRGTSLVASIDGDNMKMLAILCDQRAVLYPKDVGGTLVAAAIKVSANQAFQWVSATDDTGYPVSSFTNPLTGNPITSVLVWQASTTAAATMQIAHVYDPTP